MAQNSPHILVVDDELSMRELLEYMLAKEDYKVTCAESGREAIALLEKNHFDLLLCDIRLGDIGSEISPDWMFYGPLRSITRTTWSS